MNNNTRMTVILCGNVSRGFQEIAKNDKTRVGVFSVAVRPDTKKTDKVEFLQVKTFGNLCNVVEQYLPVGAGCLISAQLHNNKYQKKSTGETVYNLELIARDIQILSSPRTK